MRTLTTLSLVIVTLTLSSMQIPPQLSIDRGVAEDKDYSECFS